MQLCADKLRREGKRVAFVPTMGFLHEGHLSLMRIGRKAADTLVASIFVNPAQFGPGEDFDTYPRDLDRDLQISKQEGVDIVFTPDKAQLYPDNYQTYIKLDHLPHHLCGISRPVFFTGVATVVAKLFNIVKPHLVVFGEKDYQQLLIIRRMVQDLNMDIQIIGAPIVREADGLAMSSRNNYLTPEQRPVARTLYQSLTRATELVNKGVRDAARIIAEAQQIITADPDTEIDYLAVCDPETLDNVQTIENPVLMALAVKIGSTRLIDNTILDPNR